MSSPNLGRWPNLPQEFDRLTREGNSCGRRISSALPQCAKRDFSKLISERFAPRTSPGRANVSAQNLSAARSVGHPSNSSIARRRPPSCFSSVIADRGYVRRHERPFQCESRIGGCAQSDDGQSKNEPMTPRNRRAVSRRPLFSTRFKRSRSSADVISAMGRSASVAPGFQAASDSLSTVMPACAVGFDVLIYSVAIRPKVLRAAFPQRAFRSFFSRRVFTVH